MVGSFFSQFERRSQPIHRDSGPSVGSDDKDKLYCDCCQRPRHTRETCWRLDGRPPTQGRGGRSGSAGSHGGCSRAHYSTVVEPPSGSESMALSTTMIELHHNVMSRLNISTNALSSFAHSGNSVLSSNSQSVSAFMSHSAIPSIIVLVHLII